VNDTHLNPIEIDVPFATLDLFLETVHLRRDPERIAHVNRNPNDIEVCLQRSELGDKWQDETVVKAAEEAMEVKSVVKDAPWEAFLAGEKRGSVDLCKQALVSMEDERNMDVISWSAMKRALFEVNGPNEAIPG